MKIKSDGSSKNKILFHSVLFMGLGHIIDLKEYVKGILFAIVEVIGILSIPMLVEKINGLITLGSEQPNIPIKERSNSIFMLFDGIIAIVFVALFVIIYYQSIKNALMSYKEYCVKLKFKTAKESFGGLLDQSFPLFGLFPAVFLILFFVLVPLIFSAAVAFTNYSSPGHIPPNNTVDWVGLANFKDLLTGDSLWASALGRVAIWTFIWAILSTFTCYFGGMLMAILLKESKLKIAPALRSIFILPYAVPAVVSMLIWRNLLNGSFGIVNRTLMSLGVINTAIPWLSDPWLAKFTVVLINLWAGFPYFMMLITGSMTAIPEDIYEAAKIDGATSFQTFRKITLPLVLFQTMPLIIMSFTHNINNFGAIFFLSGGGPSVADTTTTSAGGTDILITWVYDLTINLLKYNYGAAIAVMIFIILAPFAIFNFVRTKSFKEGEF